MKAPKRTLMTPKAISECISHIAMKSVDAVETSLGPIGLSAGVSVESPIELKLLLALSLKVRLELHDYMDVYSQDEIPIGHCPAPLVIVPQYIIRSDVAEMRIDFALFHGDDMSIAAAIECDGHDFHERTKEQAMKDRSRDRVIQSLGVSILRFTGAEIHRDPFGCADEIISFIYRP
ncbi:endonuclease domain-containing protein [Xanthobacter versatilis]|uniref:endonuclease domain-containing protein n=1 Tax=Xanthobacter autotrophicus (strain ATCC BAA-1158 / Py2) TaxID=78245 RepID=UPI00372D714C